MIGSTCSSSVKMNNLLKCSQPVKSRATVFVALPLFFCFVFCPCGNETASNVGLLWHCGICQIFCGIIYGFATPTNIPL